MYTKTIFIKNILKTNLKNNNWYIFTNLETSTFLKLPFWVQRVKPLALFTHYFTSYKHPEVSSLKCFSQMRPLHYQKLISKQGDRKVVENYTILWSHLLVALNCLVFCFNIKNWMGYIYFSNLLLQQHHKLCSSLCPIRKKKKKKRDYVLGKSQVG